MSIGDNYCHVREIDEEKTEDKLLENCIFSIDVHATFTYSIRDDDDDDEEELDPESYSDSFESVTLRRTHEVQFDYMNRNPQFAVHEILVSMHVPVENFMVQNILACVDRLSNDDYYKNRKVLRIRVNIDVMVAELPFPIVEDNRGMVPASKAAIEGLEKVVAENPIDCAVCLEDLSTGSEAKQMPCSHLFHAHCIVSWLGKSKFCPICRFELPDLEL
ncbi:hypothetical protein PTKIN_Ptkin01aG0287100 [Pterospermum kingtungense]